jgi:hypothetical protein
MKSGFAAVFTTPQSPSPETWQPIRPMPLAKMKQYANASKRFGTLIFFAYE